MAWSTFASAVVYKWVDAQGKIQYGDVRRTACTPKWSRVSERITRVPRPRRRRLRLRRPRALPLRSRAIPRKPSTNDVSATREKQCAEAQERYKKLIEGRHIYKTGDNGERVYLSSQEIDQERLSAKQDIDDTCNSPT